MTDEERLMVEAVRRGLINPAPVDSGQLDEKTGAPLRIRVTVGTAESPADKLATLRDAYPDAQPRGDNFVFTNPDTKRPTLYNPKGIDVGDVASLGPEISEALGGIGGGALAAMAGVPTGGTAWAAMPAAAGLGAAGGREAYRLLVRGILGGRDTRSVGRQVGDAATTAGLNTVGARFADVLPGFIKNLFGAGRNGATGSTPAHVIEDFAAFGARPTAGQATGNAATQGLENAAAKMATGARTMQDFATEQVGRVAQGAEGLASRYGAGRTAEDAGVALQRGAQDFVTRFQGQADQLFDRVRNFLPRDAPAQVTNTVQALRGMGDQFGSAQNLAARLENPKLRGMLDALVQDAQQGPIPYQAVAALRSQIGRQLGDRTAVSDIPRAELEAVYGALSQDMRATAERAGPQALAAFDRANQFYRAGMQRVESVIDRVVKAGAPERAYQFAMGAENSQLRALRRSMPPEAWDVVASTTLRDLGRGKPGVQNAAGDVWSPATFLTEYNKIVQAGTSDTLFRGTRYAQLAPELDRLARVTAAMKDTAKMANPSGTAQQNYYMGLLTPFGMVGGGATVGGLMGDAGSGALIGAGLNMLSPAVASRLLTNPRFVAWLADAGTPSSRNIIDRGTAHLARLTQIAEANPAIRDEINQFMAALRMPPAPARNSDRPQ